MCIAIIDEKQDDKMLTNPALDGFGRGKYRKKVTEKT